MHRSHYSRLEKPSIPLAPQDYHVYIARSTLVPITTHTHDRRKSIGKKKQRKDKGEKRKDKKAKKTKRKGKKRKDKKSKKRQAREGNKKDVPGTRYHTINTAGITGRKQKQQTAISVPKHMNVQMTSLFVTSLLFPTGMLSLVQASRLTVDRLSC